MRWFLLLTLVFTFAACDDDDDSGSCGCPGEKWVEQDLPVELADGRVHDLDAGSGRLIGLGVTPSGTWVIEEVGGDWITVGASALPGTPPPSRSTLDPWLVAAALTVDGEGTVLVAGGAFGGVNPVLWWAESGGDWSSVTGPAEGLLHDVVPFGDGSFVAAGAATGGFAEARGSLPGDPYFGTVVMSGSGDAELVELVDEAGGVFGVGYDDGAEGSGDEPYQIVMHFDGESWNRLESPCDGCGNYKFLAVDASPDALYVGGTIVTGIDAPHGNAVGDAWLATSSFEEESGWAEIVLPEPARLDRVNAILAASDGTIWLACGGFDSTGFLVRAAPGEAAEIDLEAEDLRFFALEETADGRILASGFEAGSAYGVPVILERQD